jgi:hypothetical protein
MLEWFANNWGNIALFGGLGAVVGFLGFSIYAKFSASLSDDEWAAKIGAIVAKVVKVTPTTADDELLAKVNEIVAGVMAKKP